MCIITSTHIWVRIKVQLSETESRVISAWLKNIFLSWEAPADLASLLCKPWGTQSPSILVPLPRVLLWFTSGSVQCQIPTSKKDKTEEWENTPLPLRERPRNCIHYLGPYPEFSLITTPGCKGHWEGSLNFRWLYVQLKSPVLWKERILEKGNH